jgi:hypothetical protein
MVIALTLRSMFAGLLAALILSACGGSAQPVPLDTPTPGPSAAPAGADPATPADPAAQPAPTLPPDQVTPLPESAGYWVAPGVPYTLVDRLAPALAEAGLDRVESPDAAIVRLILNPGTDASLRARWVYALAGPFATVPDGVSWAGFESYWSSGAADALPGFGSPPQIILTPDAFEFLNARLGPPAEGLPMQIVDPAAAADLAWQVRPSISVLPFDALTPRWKVLAVDGASVLDRALNVDAYPLTVEVGVEATGERAEQVISGLASRGVWPSTNRDPGRITNVVVTGVTALVRATAKTMETRGINYPAEAILPFFADADVLHTSNEVAFSPDCPAPEWTGPPEDFCSPVADAALLDTIGLDVVELTGNHVKDWSTDALIYTLNLYDEKGIPYYGGGRDLEDSHRPAILTAPDGTRIAFVGCNDPGPWGAFAGDDMPGAAPCDDWAWITEEIRALKAGGEADLVIATVQYWELPSYAPSAEQIADFNLLAEAGADIVSGSQAHQPQGFGYADGAFIHYGVGNLFFDQMDYIENRQMFADKHVLYEGRHISTVLFTGLMEDWAQPNPMSAEDRAAFLQLIFESSNW